MSTNQLQARVVSKRVEAVGIVSFDLEAAEGHALPPFSAGSHVDVHVADGIIRQYSLCNDSRETHRYQIAVLKDPASRGGSRGMHERIDVGSVLQISEPKNHFALAHDAPHSLLMAGGIGITPLLCMAERLAMLGASFEMHYCARSRDRMAFSQRIGASRFAARVQFHFDDGAVDQKLDIPAVLGSAADNAHLYVCGPQGFMDAVLETARTQGWAEGRLHYEFFTAAPLKTDADETFDVQIASSGRVIPVPKDKTVLQALSAVGIVVPSSCEQGICGTCVIRVLAGVPDHKDLYLTPAEQAANDQFTPCCSRAKSPRLLLDL